MTGRCRKYVGYSDPSLLFIPSSDFRTKHPLMRAQTATLFQREVTPVAATPRPALRHTASVLGEAGASPVVDLTGAAVSVGSNLPRHEVLATLDCLPLVLRWRTETTPKDPVQHTPLLSEPLTEAQHVPVLATGSSSGLSQRHSKRHSWRISRPLATALSLGAGTAETAAAKARTRQAIGCMVMLMIERFSRGFCF
jgi:hypothetical protein